MVNARGIQFDVSFLTFQRVADPLFENAFVDSLECTAGNQIARRSGRGPVILISPCIRVAKSSEVNKTTVGRSYLREIPDPQGVRAVRLGCIWPTALHVTANSIIHAD